mgnify:CR=1 FL=1
MIQFAFCQQCFSLQEKAFGEIEVLKGIDTEIKKGEVVCIIGPSGSGKSTAAKLLLRNHIRNGCQIVAIDPENELEEMTKTFGGDTLDLGKGGEFGLIHPLEVLIDADEDEIRNGLGYTVLTKTLQFLNALFDKFSTLFGISIEVKPLHLLKANFPMLSTLSGILTDVKPLSLKAKSLIFLTLLGMFMSVRLS